MKRLIPMFLFLVGLTFSSTAMAQGPTSSKRNVTVKRTTTTVKRAPAGRKVTTTRVVTQTRQGKKVVHKRHSTNRRPVQRAPRKVVTKTHYEWVRGKRYLVTRKTTWNRGHKKVVVHRKRAPLRRVRHTRRA